MAGDKNGIIVPFYWNIGLRCRAIGSAWRGMLTTKLQELSQYKAKIAELEKAVLAERQAQLQRLHSDLGFATRDELIKALRGAGTPKAKRAVKKAAPAEKKPRRKRTTVTPELRANIEAAVRTGATSAAIAKQFDVSVPTVQNIKRAAGLTRGSSASVPAAGQA